MLGRGQVSCVRIPGGSPRYELADAAHHHYFRCRGCLEVYNVQGCVGNFATLVPEGFQLEAHELVLYGRCQRCVPRRRGA